jgi:MFS-type transporter involved in bile tolerance (Atg22 family)
MFLVIFPLLSSMLMSEKFPFHYTARDKDLSLARFSSIVLVCGSLLAAGPAIDVVISGFLLSTCGSGFSAFCRSLVTTFVDQRHIARLYTLLNIVDSIGAVLAGPLMAWAFIVGIRLKGNWLGLPYIVLAVCGAMAAVAIYCARLPDTQDPVQDKF